MPCHAISRHCRPALLCSLCPTRTMPFCTRRKNSFTCVHKVCRCLSGEGSCGRLFYQRSNMAQGCINECCDAMRCGEGFLLLLSHHKSSFPRGLSGARKPRQLNGAHPRCLRASESKSSTGSNKHVSFLSPLLISSR
ncbi:hypothetical protein BC567DRAFT_230264 [Phyllosticta citribraziliensis]